MAYPTGYGDIEWYSIYDGWASWEATGSSYWVKPGGSLSGFRIRSHHGPGVGKAEWIAYADTVESGSSPLVAIEYEGGNIIAPMVPEPASIALTALTLGIVGGVLRRRRARTAPWQQITVGAEKHIAEET